MRCEDLTIALLNIQVFCDVTPCRLVGSSQHFGKSSCLRLEGRTLQKNFVQLLTVNTNVLRAFETSETTYPM